MANISLTNQRELIKNRIAGFKRRTVQEIIEIGGLLKQHKETVDDWSKECELIGITRMVSYRWIEASEKGNDYVEGMTLTQLLSYDGVTSSYSVSHHETQDGRDFYYNHPKQPLMPDIGEPPYMEPPTYDKPKPEPVQDIEFEEIEPITNAQKLEDEIDKEHKEPTLPKNMPEEYWVICAILEAHPERGLEIYEALTDRKIELERIHNNTFPEWQDFTKDYFDFFENEIGEKPKVQARDWANGKRIILHLRQVGQGDARQNWKAILANWKKLDKFQQNRNDLTTIYTDINKIITQLKNGTSSKKGNREAVLDYINENGL